MTDYRELQKRWVAHPAGRLLLKLLTLPYGLAVLARQALYALGVLPSKKVTLRVICLGNLTTGGTGKTTAVVRAAMDMTKHNLRVGIVTRGYARPKNAPEVAVLSDSHRLTWQEAGDEAWMMHQVLREKNVPIFISPDRVAAAETAMMFNLDALILDDGFQHFRLHRDVDIVCLNALDPFGGGSLLPLGRLREPRRGLRRAKAVLITHSDRVAKEELKALHEEVSVLNPAAEIIEASHTPDFFINLKTQKMMPLRFAHGFKCASVAAIATPEIFEAQLRELGADLVQAWRYPDHHAFTADELRAVDALKQGLPVVTTMKDLPRLPPGWEQILTGDMYALVIRLEIHRGKKAWEALLCG